MSIVRKVIAAVLSLALPAAGLCAPFVHVHPDDHATEHHDGRDLHAHFTGHAAVDHPSDGKSLESDEHDRAVAVGAFVAVPVASFAVPDAIVSAFAAAAAAERAAHQPVDVTHSHDPPLLSSVASRAPPTFLS